MGMELLQADLTVDDDQRPDDTKKIDCVYFVKIRSFEAENLKSRIENAEKSMQMAEQTRQQIDKKLQERKWDQSRIGLQLEKQDWDFYRNEISYRTKWMESLLRALDGDCCSSMNSSHGRAKYALNSPVEELNDLIKNLRCQLQHGRSNNRAEEKHLLQEIEKAEKERERETLIANANAAAERTKIARSMNSREAIENQIKFLSSGIARLKKRGQEERANTKYLNEEFKAAEDDISIILRRLKVINQKQAKEYRKLLGLRKQSDDLLFQDECFHEYVKVLDSAKELALDRDVEGLMELSKRQVEKFMSQWSESKDFRADYEKRSLRFIESPQLSKDGRRMRINPSRRPKSELS